MHELLTVAQMRRADAAAVAAGMSSLSLMEAAGRAVAETAAAMAPEGPVLVLAGPGANGGDGYVAARRLAAAGREVRVAQLGAPRGEAAVMRERWSGPVTPAEAPLPVAALVIDALFGAGLDRPLGGLAADLVASANAHPAPVLAVDLPSGLDGDTGAPRGPCMEAAATVTFFRKKPGHLLYPGRALCGTLHLAQIGVPRDALAAIRPASFENAPALWSAALPRIGWDAHKHRRGHALVVSGPATRTGAARLTAGAALRAGAGLVTLASPPGALLVNAAHLTAVMLRRIEGAEGLAALLDGETRFSALAIGPGLGTGPRARAMVEAALAASQPLALDADALSMFAPAPAALFEAVAGRAAACVLTPHDGEFARLFPDLGPGSRAARARAASARAGAVVTLKGADTVVAAPDGRLAINANAPPWLATAGSGDVLTGLVTALLAQGAPAWEAACAAVWMHGAAAVEAGPGLIAEDLDAALRPVLGRLAAAAP